MGEIKEGQLYIVTASKARGIVKRTGHARIEIQWTHLSNGAPVDTEDIRSYERLLIERSIESGKLIVCSPDNNPNTIFLMRKRNVHS